MNRFTLRLIALLVTGFVALTSSAAISKDEPGPARKISSEEAKMDPEMGGRIDRLVKASIDRGDMSGCVVLIGRKAGVVFEKAYGNRQVEPTVEPMTTDTLFDMASLTKPLATATSMMILIERGQVRLSDKVAKLFRDFAANDTG